MTEETIRLKYGQLQASSRLFNDKPTPIVVHNFFTKKFTATLPNCEETDLDENNSNEEVLTIDDPTDIPINSTNDFSPQGNIHYTR